MNLTKPNSNQDLENFLHLLCQTLPAQAMLIGMIEPSGFRIIARFGLSTPDVLGTSEAWAIEAQTSLATRPALALMSARLGIMLQNAVGIRIEQSNLICWIFNASQAIPEKTLNLIAEQIAQMIRVKKELEHAQTQPQSKDFGRGIAQSLPIALLVMDLQDRIGFINPALTKMLGYHLETIYMKSLQSIIDPADQPKLLAAQHAIGSGQSIIQRYCATDMNSLPIWLEISRYPRFDTKQNVIGSVATLRDITEEMQTQERIERVENDLRSIQTNLQQGSGFTGRLEDIEGAVGLLQMLASNGTDGAITLDDSIIFLERGRIVAIQHPKLEGKEAAHAIVERRHGQFQFFPNVKTERPTMSLDPIVLALEYARQSDEAIAYRPARQ
jgi:PAS domain S-box-containing protein